MSFAIIRNTKYKRENLKGIYRHNERRNKNYSNDNIDKEKSYLNYSLKSPKYRYDKEFDIMKEKYDLKGQIKTVSNIACEYIITSDKQFFKEIGEEETKRYFETAYQFVAEYKNLGEQYIMSAKVHMDEETPHMHLIFLPVVHTQDKKGNNIDKLACSEFWKEKDSYRRLQDSFYQYMTSHSFELERGVPKEETKRYFETAYNFVTEYKNLGEQYIMSAKVHMDEETPHMHLIFLPVVHTQDKKGNNIDKLACSEFWKEKDSYRRLQDAFYKYMTSHNFELERGVPKEETGREHLDIKDIKK